MAERKDDADNVDGVNDTDGVRLECQVAMLVFDKAWSQFWTRLDGLLRIVGWTSLEGVYALVHFKALY